MATITSTELGASGRYINLGSPSAHDDLTAQTVMAYIRPGTIATNSVQYVFAKASDGSGPRLMVGRGPSATYFSFGSSSGTQYQPSRASRDSVVTEGTWVNICSTWDGSLTATTISHYINGTLETTYGSATNGTGSITSDAAQDVCLLNRTSDYARSFVGDCAYVARWNRILSGSEIAAAVADGPLSVPDGLILLWANEQDYSPLGLTPSARSTHVDGALPPNTALGEDLSDTTAPTLSGASGTKTGATSATGAVTTDEGNGTLYAVATTSSTKPSAAQVKAGQDHTGLTAAWADDVAVSSTGEKSFSITGLSSSTSYYVHFMHEDAAANQSTVASSSSFTTDTPDTTAPTLSSPSATATGTTTASASVSTNEATGTLYYLASENATETASTVKAASSQSVTATGSQSVSLTGLTAETSYYVHFVHRDAAGNDSAVATSAQITTMAVPPSVEYVFSGDSFNINPTGSTITGADTDTPTIVIVPRKQRIIDGDGDNTRWRQFYGKITKATGKRPLFKLLFANYFETIVSSWRPWYSYDNVNWYRFPATTLNGSHYDFQLATAFTVDDVWIGFQPGYPVSRTSALVASVAANHPDKVHQLPSANASHVVDTLSAQTNELGATVPAQPFYGYGIWDASAFGDGVPKRAVVITVGVHPGEHVGHWTFEGFVNFLVSSDAKASSLRRNYQFLIYPDINPVGHYGGHIRGQWDSVAPYKNANRDFGTDVDAFQLESSQVLRDALAVDLIGRVAVVSLDFHGQQWNPSGKPPITWFLGNDADETLAAAWEDRMQAYDASYAGQLYDSGPALVTAYMQREYESRHAYTPEAYEQHPASSGVDAWRTAGEHLAKTINDSLADMILDGAYPIIDATVTLDFPDTAPCSLLGYQVWSKLTVTDDEIAALWEG